MEGLSADDWEMLGRPGDDAIRPADRIYFLNFLKDVDGLDRRALDKALRLAKSDDGPTNDDVSILE